MNRTTTTTWQLRAPMARRFWCTDNEIVTNPKPTKTLWIPFKGNYTRTPKDMDQCKQTLNIKQWKNLPRTCISFTHRNYITHFNRKDLSCLYSWSIIMCNRLHLLYLIVFLWTTLLWIAFTQRKLLRKNRKKKKDWLLSSCTYFSISAYPVNTFLLLLFGWIIVDIALS